MSGPIAIVGGGRVGGNLGGRLASCGFEVRIGVRAPRPAADPAAGAGSGALVTSVAEAVRGTEVVFLAVPAREAVNAARAAGDLAGKVLVDCTNPVDWKDGPVWAPPPEGSVAAALALALPGVRVVKGFNAFGAELHHDPDAAGVPADVFLAGDDADAKRLVSAIAERAGFRPVDAGPLRNAALLENLAVLWIHLATAGGRGRTIAFHLAGRR